jgi:hypothetical protein
VSGEDLLEALAGELFAGLDLDAPTGMAIIDDAAIREEIA